MKKVIKFITASVFIFLFCFVIASAETPMASTAARPELTLEDRTVDFSPDGYIATATVNLPELESQIQYVAIRKSDSTPIAFPIVDAGEYYIRAYLPKTEAYDEIESIATLIIKPIEATIVVRYTKEQYTGIDNPPDWGIEPTWAQEYINIMTTYHKIDNYDSTSYEPIEKPKNLGLYYVIMTPYGYENNFICNSKTFIYEIGETNGEALTYNEARLVVPADFRCDMTETTVEYNGNQIQMPFTAYPAIVNYKIEYRKINYTGVQGEFQAQAPIEPGEYEVRATLLGQTISESVLIIEKIKPVFSIEAQDYEYTPLGIIPKVNSVYPTNVEYSFNAYLIDENDNSTIKPVEIPIKDAGRYLIVVNPSNLEHYEAVFTSEYINILPAKTSISANEQTFIYDGISKTPSYTVTPEWVQTNIIYYKINDRGVVLEYYGTKPPVDTGTYYAMISVESSKNVLSTSTQVLMIIKTGDEVSSESKSEKYLLIGDIDPIWFFVLIILPLILILGLLGFITYKQNGNLQK
ncbi:MAG: hypothetical protein A2Y17_00880 [Clostridiales bacterium GWF2_38_85]|nr:MAG: hypothetical protein A2Y17_00880 [Clostridiales bacterium GWF2_38_85]HBL84553.1 hypothetical protein [Clostridiales bacterium]